ncbi:hypothetical protein PWR63_22005 [Paraburkholderia sp. A2WS-5]
MQSASQSAYDCVCTFARAIHVLASACGVGKPEGVREGEVKLELGMNVSSVNGSPCSESCALSGVV